MYALLANRHPPEALRSVRAVRRLLATGDTSQIFAIFRALRGRSGIKAFRRFQQSPTGAAVLRERRVLLNTLTDRAALSALPAGSFGRTYFDFMEEEKLTGGRPGAGLAELGNRSGAARGRAVSRAHARRP